MDSLSFDEDNDVWRIRNWNPLEIKYVNQVMRLIWQPVTLVTLTQLPKFGGTPHNQGPLNGYFPNMHQRIDFARPSGPISELLASKP